MSDFAYTGQGGFKLRGCAKVTVTYIYLTKFQDRDEAYIQKDATRGKLNRIFIKQTNVVLTNSQPVINYVDTFNWVWLENELVTRSEAQSLVNAYKAKVIQERKLLESACNGG